MKKIIVACGSGIATSTIVIQKIKSYLETKDLLHMVQFTQCTVGELATLAKGHDLIVTTSFLSEDFNIPVVSGISFISGMGIESVMNDIIAKLEL